MLHNRETVVNDDVKKYIAIFCNCIKEAIPDDTAYTTIIVEDPLISDDDKIVKEDIIKGIKTLIEKTDESVQTIINIKNVQLTDVSQLNNEDDTQWVKDTASSVDNLIDFGKYLTSGSNQFDRNAFLAAGQLFGEYAKQMGGGKGGITLFGQIIFWVGVAVLLGTGWTGVGIGIGAVLILFGGLVTKAGLSDGGKKTRRRQRPNKKRRTLKYKKNKRNTFYSKKKILKKRYNIQKKSIQKKSIQKK